MSAPENQDSRGRLLTYLFWGGIGLAPLAALLLIVVGSSTAGLRFAAILAILAVMAIGISITLRRDVTTIKVDLEETILDEIDMLRGDVRADITTAARATHRALSEKVAHLHESLEQVRRQVESAPMIEIDRPMARPAVAPPPRMPAVTAGPNGAVAPNGQGVVQRTETVRVTTRTIVDPDEDPYARNHQGHPGRDIESRDERNGHDRPARDRRPEYRDDQPHPADSRGSDPRGREIVPSRQSDFEVSARQAWGNTSDDELAEDPRWVGMRAGDRWAEVRQDEHGREVRMAERRAAIRTDETGTHLRVVDRWSTIREDHRQDEAANTFENTGETRAQRRAREAAEHDDWERPSNGRRPELPSAEPRREDRAESRSLRHVDDDAPSHSRRSRTTDGYQSFTPRPLESSRPADDRSDRDSWDEPSRHGESQPRSRRASEDRSRDQHGLSHGRGNDYRDDEAGSHSRDGVRVEQAWSPRASRQSESQPESSRGSRRRDDSHDSHDVIPAQRRPERIEQVDRTPPPPSDPWAARTEMRGDRDHVADRGTARSWESAHDRETPDGRDIAGDHESGRDRRPARDDRSDQRRSSRWDERADDREPQRRDDRAPQRHDDRAVRDDQAPQRRDDRAPQGRDNHAPQRRDDSPARDDRRADRRDDRSDDRWEREPSGPRSQMRPRQYDFEVSDERWH